MNWRLGLALVFFLVLLFAILHIAMRVVPSVHMSAEEQVIPQSPNYGQSDNPIKAKPLTSIPSHWSTIQEGEQVRIYPNGMQFDASGNVLYPFGTVSYH